MSAGLPDWWTLGLAEVWHVHASWVDPSATRVAPGVHDYAQYTRARGLPPGEGSRRRWPPALLGCLWHNRRCQAKRSSKG